MSALRRMPRTVWALGLVSMFMDMSSELVHSLLPLFMVTTLGASAFVVGIIEGIAEATALIVKVFSGYISDRFRKRKLLVAIGYGMAALAKPLFPLAPSLGWIVGARFVDRVGKGIRGAPRDALVADVVPQELRGAAYGLRQALDTVGAVAGPLAAIAAMAWFANDFRAVFWVAVIPAFIALALVVFGVEEPAHLAADGKSRPPIRLADVKRLEARYWSIVGIAAVFTLARFSEAFLVLRAQDVGMQLALVPLVMVVMSAVYAAAAYPVGLLADQGHRRALLAGGLVALIAADLVLAQAASVTAVLAGAAIWGLHMGLTQGLLATIVADRSPPDLRGTAFGLFNLASGVMMLVASGLAGWLWDAFGPARTFYAGAAFSAAALLLILAFARPRGDAR